MSLEQFKYSWEDTQKLLLVQERLSFLQVPAAQSVVWLREEYFSSLLPFLRFSTETLEKQLQRTAHYGIHLSNRYARVPPNIMEDTDFSWILFSEFGQPVRGGIKNDEQLYGLALTGFSIGKIRIDQSETEQWGLTVHQHQTAAFNSENEMLSLLGFIDYRKLLTHVTEQLAYYVQTSTPLSVCAHQVQLLGDDAEARRRIKSRYNDSPPYEKWISLFNAEKAQLKSARIEWLRALRYTRPADWIDRNGYMAEVRIKLVNDVTPDQNLQTYFTQLDTGNL